MGSTGQESPRRHGRAGTRFPSLLVSGVLVVLAGGCGRVDYVLGMRVEPDEAGDGGSAGAAGAGGSGSADATVLPERIDLSPGGPSTRLLLGDVTGDGRLDLVTMQPDYVEDDRHVPHEVSCLTAFDLTGNVLWQIGEVDPDATESSTDIPAQIYDIDADGYNEVLAVMQGRFRVFDGRTGEPEYDWPLPDPDAHDAIIIANFAGRAHPQDIVLKDRYERLWAFDRSGNLRFEYTGAIGHFPWPYDWDGDGREELMAGCDYLEDDGTLQWSCASDLDGIADAVFAGDIDQDPGNGTELVVGGGDTLAYDRHGSMLWRFDTVESQNVALGDFRPDLAGLEIAGLDRVSRGEDGTDAMFLLSAEGEALFYEDRPVGSGWSTIVTTMSNWGGEGEDLIVSYRRGGGVLPTVYDGHFNVVTSFPGEWSQIMHADLCGDSREEVIVYTDRYADLFYNGECDLSAALTGTPRAQSKRLYNWTRYWGGEYPAE